MNEDNPASPDIRDILLTVITATCPTPSNHEGRVWAVDKIDRSGMIGSPEEIEEALARIAGELNAQHQATGCSTPLRLTLRACPKQDDLITHQR